MNKDELKKKLEEAEEKIQKLARIATNLQFYARRYAEGRRSVACTEVNSLTEAMLKENITCWTETAGERQGSIWAYDGDPICCNANYYEKEYGKDGNLKK